MSRRRHSEEVELKRAIEEAVANDKTYEIVDAFLRQTEAGKVAFQRMELYEKLIDQMATERRSYYRFRESLRGAIVMMEASRQIPATPWSGTEVDEPPPEVEIALS